MTTLRIRLLGPVAVERAGEPIPLPRSRKLRALLAVLVLERRPVSRSRLCDLLWDVPNDPRGELRWCLSKLRQVLDEPERRRVICEGAETIALDLAGDDVDVFAPRAPSDGELLEGMDVDVPAFSAWLAAQRARFVHAPAHGVERSGPEPPPGSDLVRRGSVVVMPFATDSETTGALANGLTDDVITRLAKLRVLFVIARGTSYALRERALDPREVGRLLGVEYVVTGGVRRRAGRTLVRVELVAARTGGIVWTDELDEPLEATFEVLDSIVDRVAGGVAEEIEREECRRARIKPPSSLDAWEAYHRGLWHMYRFTGPDNVLAARFFEHAISLDADFARAHAGLSFTHFQNVFLGLTPDREAQLGEALSTAARSLAADERDPGAHWAMGRALWLHGDHPQAIAELERSVELSPNFALGHYTLGFVEAQSGDPRRAMNATERARRLSPLDPLQFGMLGSRALAHLRLGERADAAEWAVKAATRPNAHAHILAIAATSLALCDRRKEALAFVEKLRRAVPGYGVDDFLRAFRFDAEAEKLLRLGARRLGF